MSDTSRVDAQQAADPLVLAIDIGTSSARCLVYDSSGKSVDGWEAHRPYEVRTTPDGGVEGDPALLLDLVCSCVDEVMRSVTASSRRIALVACDTFWHSLTGVGPQGEALTPVYTWADTRSGQAARKLRSMVDERALHARTGAVVHSSYLPAKLLWLHETRPELTQRVSYWMSFAEYLFLQLFGERRVSVSMASGTGLFDQHSCAWDAGILDVLPIQPEQLSPICEFTDSFNGLRPPFGERWPPLATVPWYLALGDGGCNNVGSGAFDDRWAVAMIGTSGALRVVRTTSHVEIPSGLWTYRIDRRRIVQGGALSDGGNVFAWLERTLRLDSPTDLQPELSAMRPDAHGLTVLPFLAGERSPNWNVDARGALIGMTLDTEPLDIARATLEAVSYRFGVIHDSLKHAVPSLEGIIGSGAGLLHSPVWMQIMTDVLGEPMVASAVPEASSRGAALLVLEAAGAIPDLRAVPSPLGERYVPDKDNTRIYRAAMQRQEDYYRRIIGPQGEGDSSVAWQAGPAGGVKKTSR